MTHARNGESFLPDQHTEKLMRILEKDLEKDFGSYLRSGVHVRSAR